MLNEYDRKYLWIFVAVEVISFLLGKLIIKGLGLITSDSNGWIIAYDLLNRLLIPALLIIAALVIMAIYKNNQQNAGGR